MAVIQISRPSSDIVAKNLATSLILTTGSDFKTVFQAVIDSHLTAARTEQDTIICFGDFDLDGSIALDSLVKVVLTGSNIECITSTGSFGAFSATSKNTIDIIGGTMQCNILPAYGVLFDTCTDVTVDSFKILSPKNHNVNFNSCTGFAVTNSYHKGGGDDCITALASTEGVISHNRLNVGTALTGGSHGVEIEGTGGVGSSHITVSNNVIWTDSPAGVNDTGGILVDSAAEAANEADPANCSHITITDNIIIGMYDRGIMIRSQGAGQYAEHIHTSGNIMTDCGANGSLAFLQVRHASSTGDIVNGTDPTTGKWGITLGEFTSGNPTDDITVVAPIITNIRRSAIYLPAVKNFTISSPRIESTGTEGASAKYAVHMPNSAMDCEDSLIEDVTVIKGASANTNGLFFNSATNLVVKGGKIGSTVTNAVQGLTSSIHVEGIKGYTTEASAAETSSGTTIVVTHGLARTPLANQIHITPTNATAGGDSWYISAIGSTTFTINCTNTATFSWEIKASGSVV